MNKQTEELALSDTDIARIYRQVYGAQRFSGIDREFARAISDRVTEEIAKQSEPVKLTFPTCLRKMWSGGEVQKFLDDLPSLYANPLPQPDLVAEIERVKAELGEHAGYVSDLKEQVAIRDCSLGKEIITNDQLCQQLSAAQAELSVALGQLRFVIKSNEKNFNDLQAAQADNEQLVKALEQVKENCLFTDDDGQIGVSSEAQIDSQLFDEICEAIAAHKARQGKEQQ